MENCSIIIVDYCSIDRTIQYVEHLQEQLTGIPEFHVVIVDNSPAFDAMKSCMMEYGKATIISLGDKQEVRIFELKLGKLAYYHSGENLGYAKGNNLGTQIADAIFNDDYYLITNNDLSLPDKMEWDYIRNLFAAHKDIAVVGPRVLGLDGRDQSPHKKLSPQKYLIGYYWIKYFPVFWKGGELDYTGESKNCYRVMGCFMFIRAKDFRKVERFDPKTFMYSEEPILSEKLLKEGKYVYFCNDIFIVHEHGTTVKNTTAVKAGEKWSFDSRCYYYEHYLKTSRSLIGIAKISFQAYLLCLPLILKMSVIRKYLKEKQDANKEHD